MFRCRRIRILHKEHPKILFVLSLHTIKLSSNDKTKSRTAGSKKTSLCWFKSKLTTEAIDILHKKRPKVGFVLYLHMNSTNSNNRYDFNYMYLYICAVGRVVIVNVD